MSKVLVTGATGNVGSRLVRLLTARGQAVRAFTRKGEAARFDPKVEVVAGDFTDKESLRSVMKGVSRVYLLSPATGLELFEANALEAAKEARIELLVKHSVAGAPYKATDIPRWHRASEERIEASGLPFAFLRPASFASNALGWAARVKAQGTVYGALGEAALPVIHPEDIAEVAAAVLSTPGHAGKAYDLTGPEAITTAQQVAALGSVLGKTLKYVNVPDEAARESMLKVGMPPQYVNAMIGLIQTLRGIGRIEPSRDVKAILGREPRSFRQWAEANAAAFR
jgi:uncharacterized protein YbjT (DUF2867 family)